LGKEEEEEASRPVDRGESVGGNGEKNLTEQNIRILTLLPVRRGRPHSATR
jgi:hypothetical protein